MVFDYIIVGAGASGVTCAIELLKRGKRVLILEHKDRMLKKVLVTGNGQCNFTNKYATYKNYYGNNKELIKDTLEKYKPSFIIDYFSKMGIYAKEQSKGKMYPNSLQAASIVDVLRANVEYLGANIVYLSHVDKCYKKNKLFYVNEYIANNLVIATGGNSYKELGSDGSGYELARLFGHSITKLDPVLVQLQTEKQYVKGLEGIRLDVNLSVYKDNRLLKEDFGELLFAPYGISGPTVFNISYLTSLYGFDLDIYVDFVFNMSDEDLLVYLKDRRDNMYFIEAVDFLNGFLPKKLGMKLLKDSGLEKLNIMSCEISDKVLETLTNNIKRYKIKVFDTTGFKKAQVTAGGVDSLEVDINFQSKIHENLYFIGEILDIFGDCGGYNLQFAFASGIKVGRLNE